VPLEGDELDRYLDDVLIGGREPAAIVIEPYNAAWPERFKLERGTIRAALGGDAIHPIHAIQIEHIGSTSVPGLAAKPIIDILVTVEDPEDDRALTLALERAGYQLRVREPGHRMFRTPAALLTDLWVLWVAARGACRFCRGKPPRECHRRGAKRIAS
jgi:GrpB-like predicted nucleotidyltransferase (UPF0157 family)